MTGLTDVDRGFADELAREGLREALPEAGA